MDKTTISKSTPKIRNQAKLLIIDDERLLRQSIKRILEKVGFYVETAMDYKTAHKCIENQQFDLLLVDIVLPKISGIELIEKLNQEFSFSSAIIFITGEPNLQTAIDAMRVGANDYLEKPVGRDILINSIQRALVNSKKIIQIQEKNTLKSVTLNPSFIKSSEEPIELEILKTMQNSLSDTHDALLKLKKRYGDDFSEDQKTLLNIIVQNNSSMRKMINNFEN